MPSYNQPQFAGLSWRGPVPVAEKFDDPYFSLENGLAETRHVFIDGNNLPSRFQAATKGFHIGELGFGTGLNLLCAWKAWLNARAPGQLHFTSFEAYPMAFSDMQKALANWPELGPLASQMIAGLKAGRGGFETASLKATIVSGDARSSVPRWQAKADAWFLDGFSPAKNPSLWQADLMQAVAAHTNPGGSFATYSAAGHIRTKLQNAGFAVSRVPGYGRKRHMTTGILQSRPDHSWPAAPDQVRGGMETG